MTKQSKEGSNEWRIILFRIIVVALALVAWETLAVLNIINPFWISQPSAITKDIVVFLSTTRGWSAIWVTFYEAIVGLGLGSVLGVASAFLLTRSRTAMAVLNPFIAVLNSVPRLALTPLFIVWFGVGSVSKVAMVFTLVYFIMLVNAIGGIESVDDDLLVVSKLLGATAAQRMQTIVIPTCVPWILAGLRVGLGNAFAGAVVAEMIAGSGGLGFYVSYAAGLLNLTRVFTAVILVMALAYVADVVLLRIERSMLRWRSTTLGSAQ